MEFSELTIRIILLFFPGILCQVIVDTYSVHKDREPFDVVLHSFLYGILSYVLYSVILVIRSIETGKDGISASWPATTFATALTNENVEVSFLEIGCVAFWSIILGLFICACINHSWHFRIVKRLGVTKKFSDPNVWAFSFNLADVEWANVRDYDNGLMYMGYIQAFRDVDEIAELLLSDVIVYDEFTGEELYRTDKVYLARPHTQITIDFPKGS